MPMRVRRRVWHCMLADVRKPEWWRGESPPDAPVRDPWPTRRLTGDMGSIPDEEPDPQGLHPLYFFKASVTDAEVWLNDVHVAVEWSEFDNCHFRQRVKPITNQQGFSAQGSFANRQARYRNCVFERVRFKLLGGFSMSRGWYENCTFLNCRWEGHFAHDASVVDSTFIGRMNGCVWFGESERGPNVIRGNDFTQVQFTNNVGWRRSYPVSEQAWPSGFHPRLGT
jgi:hypothetical protein